MSSHLVAPFDPKSQTIGEGASLDSNGSSLEESVNVADDDADWDLDATSDELDDLLVPGLQCRDDCCKSLLAVGGVDLFENSKVEGSNFKASSGEEYAGTGCCWAKFG